MRLSSTIHRPNREEFRRALIHRIDPDSVLEGTGFEPSVSRREKWSMPSSSDQTRVGRTLTLGGGAESSLEGRDIELSVSPKDIRTSPYDLCANCSDRRQSREGDRWFESTSLQRGDGMGQAAKKWHHRRWNRTDGVP